MIYVHMNLQDDLAFHFTYKSNMFCMISIDQTGLNTFQHKMLFGNEKNFILAYN